jgi:lipid-A-disaccharide synthase
VTPLTYFLGRQLLKSRYIAMPNILLNEEVVPEILQERVTAEILARETLALLDEPGRIAAMRANLARIRPMLGEEGVLRRVAGAVYQTALEARTQVAYEPV